MTPVIVTGLSDGPLDAATLVTKIRRTDCGAIVTFEGTTRSPNGGRVVERLSYEAWAERAEQQLRSIAEEVAREHALGGVLAVHRTGDVPPGESSVLVAASAPHRDAAFLAARALIDRIKAEVAIWKKEITADGAAWVGIPGEGSAPAR